jgi:hypothetical protein
MSMGMMDSALEFSRLAKAASKVWDTRSVSFILTSEGAWRAFFSSAVLSVLPF